MCRWRMASVPKFNWVRGQASPLGPAQHEEAFQGPVSGFHDNATLTLSPSLTTAVAATIAASTVSLGVSVTVVIWSIQAVISMPA
ncbi:hypothetical protein SSBR45G_60370 [Bradyrhizobium sp. SSBR45G]|uniref:hypothetical protein n=1 Tax=unclassified Bradyrhizobium TaxID=2631580 RepID=UPI002342A48A|nr:MULTISPECIES: hypothetical protein [unclassified Bradyrhizobium]GLH81128.1 hypothetical protein SSBR45G_60370 [Bradyrhizobium sp. SSBR45G]GLH88499.1 hypothetical protein SSBR45R_59600 [Bradyrhizobium sp. SSBR45R]